MKRSIILLCLILFPIYSFTQGEASVWYFGTNAGIDFSSGNADVIVNGELETLEGCATISDQNGSLLFYTDGITVYNNNHQVMQNGVGLSGDISSSQSAIIIPKPGTSNSYYIFTVDADAGPNGLQYSEVDMSLDNGLGAVTNVKNVLLMSPSSEQLIATKKNNEDAYWIVGHKFDSNEYLAYEINVSGVNHNPVISAIGTEVNASNNIGQIKFSYQRNRLAAARTGNVQIFDFNNETGEFTNLIHLGFNENFYGIEFSPNGQFLYTSNFDSGMFFGGGIRQFNLLSGDEDDIALSAVTLVSEENALFGALQLAPDGKIYVARVDDVKLDIIENPDELGLNCNYNSGGLFLEGGISIFGLPTFIQPYFRAAFDFCIGEEAQFYSEVLGEYDSLIWDFGDGITSTENNPIHNYGSAGNFTVNLSVFSGGQTLTVSKTITILNESISYEVELVQCDDEISDGLTTFSLNSYKSVLFDAVNIPYSNYNDVNFFESSMLINEINDDEYINTSNPQTIFATVENIQTNCIFTIEVTLNVTNELLDSITIDKCIDRDLSGITNFNLNAITNQILNSTSLNLSIGYFETYNDALLEENLLISEFTNNIPYNQTIYARADNGDVCYGIYPVELNTYESPNVLESEDIFYCLDVTSNSIILDSGIIDGNSNDYTYNWSTGENTEQIQVNNAGDYSVVVSNLAGCAIERMINVQSSSIAAIEYIEVIDLSENNTISILASGEGDYLYALDNENGTYQESNTFENVPVGIHTIYIKDIKANCGTVSEDISILGFSKFFTPNGDTYNDTWFIKGFPSGSQIEGSIEIYDRYGKLITVLNETQPKWDGTFNGKKMPTDDYWFVAKLPDGRTYRGHFTLKR